VRCGRASVVSESHDKPTLGLNFLYIIVNLAAGTKLDLIVIQGISNEVNVRQHLLRQLPLSN
jgi:hypothetical protein